MNGFVQEAEGIDKDRGWSVKKMMMSSLYAGKDVELSDGTNQVMSINHSTAPKKEPMSQQSITSVALG